MEQVNEHTPIVFIVKNNNDFEVKNVEIFNTQGQKATKGVEIVSKYVEEGSQPQFTLQQIYDYLNEGNVMPIRYVFADCLSVEVPRKVGEWKKKLQDWQTDIVGDVYEIYCQRTIASAMEAKINIHTKDKDYNDKLLIPPNYDMKRRFLSGLDNGWSIIFYFDKTTKIEIESIPPRTEIRYIFTNR